MSESSQLLQQVPGAATRVEDHKVVPACVSIPYPVEDDGSACRVPPVGLLDPVEDLVGV